MITCASMCMRIVYAVDKISALMNDSSVAILGHYHDNGCVLFQIWIDLDLTDEIDPVRWKRTCRLQIFLANYSPSVLCCCWLGLWPVKLSPGWPTVLVEMLNLTHSLFLVVVGMAKSDFLRWVGAVQILIENAVRFAQIDLDRSTSKKECLQ